MSSLYAMRRANGDWFALEHQGRLRVPVYRSRNDAWNAHLRYSGMLLFRPLRLDEGMLHDLAATDERDDVCFWLVDSSSHNLRQGKMLEFADLVSFIRQSAGHQKETVEGRSR